MKEDVLLIDKTQIEYIETLVNANGVVPLRVTGTSMLPFIYSEGDTVYLVKCKKREIKKGLIVLFKRDNGDVVLHRVRDIKNGKIIMNGDAQNWCEEITFDNVIAKVIEYEHNGKKIDPQSKKRKIVSSLWYPTYVARPYIIAGVNKIKKITKGLSR